MKMCTYCHESVPTKPLMAWNHPGEVKGYYCERHYHQAYRFEQEQKRRFLDYYKDESARQFLSGEMQILYEELSHPKKK